MEVLRIPDLTPELTQTLIDWQNMEVMDAALAKGKGVILVASHVDNVDLAGCTLSIQGLPVAVVAKKMGSKAAEDFIVTVRASTGIKLLPTRKARNLVRQHLAENKIVAIVVDQHLRPRHSIVCSFFGQLAATTDAPVRFALATGATILAGVMYRKGMSRYHGGRLEGFELEMPFENAEANVRHNTERINRIVESWIREFPEQWLWPHKRWKVHDNPEGWEIPEDLRHLVGDRT